MPKSEFTEVPLPMEWIAKYPVFCKFLTDFFHHVYGLGADVTGSLDKDNLSAEIPDVNETATVTGVWTFTAHPLGLDHTKIANIGTKTHPQIDTHLGDDSLHVPAHLLETDPHTGYQKESEKGVASGYASLESDVKVTVAQLRNRVWIGVTAPDPADYPLWLDIS